MTYTIAEERRREGVTTLDWTEDQDCWVQAGQEEAGFNKGEPYFPFDSLPENQNYEIGQRLVGVLRSAVGHQPLIHRQGRDLFGNIYRVVRIINGDDTEPLTFFVWQDIPEEMLGAAM